MKIIFPLALIIFLAASPLPTSAAAPADSPDPAEPDSGAVVCPPGIYATPPDDCLPLGPSVYLTEMAGMGIALPLAPLPIFAPPPSLNDVPYHYLQIEEAGAPVYDTLGEAQGKSGGNFQILLPGFDFVGYTETVQTDHGIFFYLDNGGWVAGGKSRISAPTFQGVQVAAMPHHGFGWGMEEADIKQFPSFNFANQTVGRLHRYQIVPIYTDQNIEGIDWYLIGPNQWVQGREVAGVFPDDTPPDGVTNGRWIDVNLAEQTVSVYDNNQMVFATLASTGLDPFWTRPGLFHIQIKKDKEIMSGGDIADHYYLQDVPFTMYFDEARALHGAYWHTLFGYAHSHGCVNLTIGDAHWIYDWATQGDWVWVHDPSGLTPTDPKLYGAGGA